MTNLKLSGPRGALPVGATLPPPASLPATVRLNHLRFAPGGVETEGTHSADRQFEKLNQSGEKDVTGGITQTGDEMTHGTL